jgi:hypothetical protein
MRSHSSVIGAPEATQSHAPFARPAKNVVEIAAGVRNEPPLQPGSAAIACISSTSNSEQCRYHMNSKGRIGKRGADAQDSGNDASDGGHAVSAAKIAASRD